MNIFEILVLNCVFILFPLIIYLFYIAYSKNIGHKENNLFLDFALITSFYLCLKYGTYNLLFEQLFVLNVVLIVSFIKRRICTSLLITSFIIYYYNDTFNINIFLISLEYLYYLLICNLLIKKEINNYKIIDFFCISKFIWLLIETFLLDSNIIIGNYKILKLLFLIIILYITAYAILMLFEKGEEILKYHMNIKELEQEKQIRTSLFKITHEIKNPIAVCKGYLDMFDINNTEHTKRYIPILKEEIAKTLVLLQDFLAMNKIKIEKDIVDINYLIENVIKNFTLMLNNKNIKLENKIIDDEIFIEGDYNRLTQVIINIIKNAIEAMEETNNGLIKIEEKIVNNNIHVLITDNGPGISEEDLKRIKEPFFTTKKNGTGLGVSLSDEIIKAHNGKLLYHSNIKVGTEVEIVLPIKEY